MLHRGSFQAIVSYSFGQLSCGHLRHGSVKATVSYGNGPLKLWSVMVTVKAAHSSKTSLNSG